MMNNLQACFVKIAIFYDNLDAFIFCRSNSTAGHLITVTSTLMVTPTKTLNKQELLCEVSHPAFQAKNITVVTLNITCKQILVS